MEQEIILDVVRELLILRGFIAAFGKHADEMTPDQIRKVTNEATVTLETAVAMLENLGKDTGRTAAVAIGTGSDESAKD